VAKQKLGISGIFGNSQENPDSYTCILSLQIFQIHSPGGSAIRL